MMTSPSLITGPAPSFWAEQDRVSDSPPILRARPEDGRHDQLGIFQTALLGRITQASTLLPSLPVLTAEPAGETSQISARPRLLGYGGAGAGAVQAANERSAAYRTN